MSQIPPPPYVLRSLSEASAPSYSARPSRGEQSLCYRPGHGLEQPQASDVHDVFVHPFSDDIAVLLEGQTKNVDVPTYHKNGMVTGCIILESHLAESVTSIVFEIQAAITFDLSHVYDHVTILDHHETLFPIERGITTCPTSLPISYSLPDSFEHANKKWSLPPSYLVSWGEYGSQQRTTCKYFARILVTKMLHRKVPLLTTSYRYELPLHYFPRSRPARPLFGLNFSGSSFLSLLKQCPEEWRQFLYTMDTQNHGPTFSCQVYLPSAGAFALREDTPFFIQITGETTSLTHLRCNSEASERPVSMFILRQILVDYGGRTIPFQFPIGSAEMEAIPPALSVEENLNWQGILRVDNEITVPTFQTARLTIQDFIVLEVYVQNTKVRHGHAISLVTESWSEWAA